MIVYWFLTRWIHVDQIRSIYSMEDTQTRV